MDEALIKRITEEVIAVLIASGVTVRPGSGCSAPSCSEQNPSAAEVCAVQQAPCQEVFTEQLITEAAARTLCRRCGCEVRISKKTIVTPSAWDVFKENKVKVEIVFK